VEIRKDNKLDINDPLPPSRRKVNTATHEPITELRPYSRRRILPLNENG
jgi:hypothetical protein